MTFIQWSSETADSYWYKLLIKLIQTTDKTTTDTNQDVISVMSITTAVSHYLKGEILHSDGMKVISKMISQPPLGFSDVQLIILFAVETVNNSCGDAWRVMNGWYLGPVI